MYVSYVIPSLNERDGIRRTIARIALGEHRQAGDRAEIVVVDGLSTDGTPEVARELGARVILERRPGYGRAYKAGFEAAQGDSIVTGDADGSYPFEEAPRLLRRLGERGLDFITVNRFAGLQPGSMSGKHRLGNGILNAAARVLFRVRLRDTQSGMWVFRRRALELVPYREFHDGMPFSEEFKIRAFRHPQLHAEEVPGRYSPRTGAPKLSSWRDGWRNLRHLVRLRMRRSPRGNGSS